MESQQASALPSLNLCGNQTATATMSQSSTAAFDGNRFHDERQQRQNIKHLPPPFAPHRNPITSSHHHRFTEIDMPSNTSRESKSDSSQTTASSSLPSPLESPLHQSTSSLPSNVKQDLSTANNTQNRTSTIQLSQPHHSISTHSNNSLTMTATATTPSSVQLNLQPSSFSPSHRCDPLSSSISSSIPSHSLVSLMHNLDVSCSQLANPSTPLSSSAATPTISNTPPPFPNQQIPHPHPSSISSSQALSTTSTSTPSISPYPVPFPPKITNSQQPNRQSSVPIVSSSSPPITNRFIVDSSSLPLRRNSGPFQTEPTIPSDQQFTSSSRQSSSTSAPSFTTPALGASQLATTTKHTSTKESLNNDELFVAAKESCIRKLKRLAELFPKWAQQHQTLQWHINAVLLSDGWPRLLRYVEVLQQLAQGQKSLSQHSNSSSNPSDLPSISVLKRLDSIRQDFDVHQNLFPLPLPTTKSSNSIPSQQQQSHTTTPSSIVPSESSISSSSPPQNFIQHQVPSGFSSATGRRSLELSSCSGTSVFLGQKLARPHGTPPAIGPSSSASSLHSSSQPFNNSTSANENNDRYFDNSRRRLAADRSIQNSSCFEPLPVPAPVPSQSPITSVTSESEEIDSPYLSPSREDSMTSSAAQSSTQTPSDAPFAGLTTSLAAAIIFLSRAINVPIPEVRSMLDTSCTNAISRKAREEQLQRDSPHDPDNSNLSRHSRLAPFSPSSSRRTSLSSQFSSSQQNERNDTSHLPPSMHGPSVRSMKGVSFDRSKRNWEASWLDARTGRRVKKCFSEGRWGSSARDMAILARKEAEDSGVISTRQNSGNYNQGGPPSHQFPHPTHQYEPLVSPTRNTTLSSIMSNSNISHPSNLIPMRIPPSINSHDSIDPPSSSPSSIVSSSRPPVNPIAFSQNPFPNSPSLNPSNSSNVRQFNNHQNNQHTSSPSNTRDPFFSALLSKTMKCLPNNPDNQQQRSHISHHAQAASSSLDSNGLVVQSSPSIVTSSPPATPSGEEKQRTEPSSVAISSSLLDESRQFDSRANPPAEVDVLNESSQTEGTEKQEDDRNRLMSLLLSDQKLMESLLRQSGLLDQAMASSSSSSSQSNNSHDHRTGNNYSSSNVSNRLFGLLERRNQNGKRNSDEVMKTLEESNSDDVIMNEVKRPRLEDGVLRKDGSNEHGGSTDKWRNEWRRRSTSSPIMTSSNNTDLNTVNNSRNNDGGSSTRSPLVASSPSKHSENPTVVIL